MEIENEYSKKLDPIEGIIYYSYFIILFLGIGIDTPYGSQLLYIFSAISMSLVAIVSMYVYEQVVVSKFFLIIFSPYFVWLIVLSMSGLDSQSIQYVLTTSLVMFSIIIFIPKVIIKRKYKFARTLSLLGALFVGVGILILVFQQYDIIEYSNYTEKSVLFIDNIRLSSLFNNSNAFGKFMCFAGLASLYLLVKEERHSLYLVSINIIGLLMSNGQTSYLGFAAGSVILLSHKYTQQFVLAGIIFIPTYISLIGSGLVDDTTYASFLSGRNYLWQATLQRTLESPVFGVGTTDIASEVGNFLPEDSENYAGYGPHNTYLSIILRNGFVGGIPYILSLFYVLVVGSRFVNSAWDRFVLGSLFAMLVIMIHETLTLGGLSMDSIILATFVGLVLYNWEKAYRED